MSGSEWVGEVSERGSMGLGSSGCVVMAFV